MKGHSGINWHYDINGEGDFLLFIHGWGVDHRIWRQQSKFFSRYYKVMMIDLPGHGKSSWQKVPLEDMAKDLHNILRIVSIDPITIVGSSLGGLLGLKLYALHPEKIKRMVFVGSMPKFSRSQDYPFGLDVKEMRKLGGQLDVAYPQIVNIFFRSLFTKEERESRRFKWLQKFRRTDETPMQAALMEYLDILEAEDLRGVLKDMSIPMQFINGEGDEICCPETVKYLRKLCPDSRFDSFAKCGHFPFLSQPHTFNQILNDFLFQTV